MQFTGERLIPDQERDDDLLHEHLVRYLFAARLAGGRAVLDAGCGAGYGAALLAGEGALSVMGIDLSAEAIAYAQEHYRLPNLRFAVEDLQAISLAPASLDLVTSFEVIEHLDEPAALVQGAARLLRNGGIFLVSTPNTATYPKGNPFHKHEMGIAQFVGLLGQCFPAIHLFEQDYAAALSLRPSGANPAGNWRFMPAEKRTQRQPDYWLAVCARDAETLRTALASAQSIMYELPADRLGERIRDLLTVLDELERERSRQSTAGDELERLQAAYEECDAALTALVTGYAQLKHEMLRQSEWAADMERRLLALRRTWYVRLFGRRAH